jgi:hypothetical protein
MWTPDEHRCVEGLLAGIEGLIGTQRATEAMLLQVMTALDTVLTAGERGEVLSAHECRRVRNDVRATRAQVIDIAAMVERTAAEVPRIRQGLGLKA